MRNENSVRIQMILTALITYLLLAIYRKAQNYTGSLWILLAEVRATLFQRPSNLQSKLNRNRCLSRVYSPYPCSPNWRNSSSMAFALSSVS